LHDYQPLSILFVKRQVETMTSLLQKAFDKASQLPADTQDELAKQLLEDLESEQKWATAFDSSKGKLDKLAKEALQEYKSGKTKQMGFDEL
jgi:hypothetical protein